MQAIMYADGGARGNPGPAGSGAVIFEDQGGEPGDVIGEVSRYIGETTNNQAEYRAIIYGLQEAVELGVTQIHVRLDSQLAVKQIKGEYRVKNPGLAERFLEVKNLLTQFEKYSFEHVRREKNTHADALVNKAIDEALGL
jgi:ribonuclease HI